LSSINYEKVGLKVGLEIHQQLDSEKKLFCGCSTKLFKGNPEITFSRQLRPTQSELGQIDHAAFFEFQQGRTILYEGDQETACLVEMDEEPPHELNLQALKTALVISLMHKAHPVNEVHVMRKTVIDGSNTTGFQRTCVVAMGGEIAIDGKKVPIQHVGLEEDAARKVGEDQDVHRFRIDRLCIPLVEVATAPVIYTPKEATEVALGIGRILRATGMVKRGLGTIRQDLNISIRDGALVEIKGVQELELISLVVENEVHRQISLLEIKDELRKRKVKEADIEDEFINISKTFSNTRCKVIHDALDRGDQVVAVKLPSFGGLLSRELMPNIRFGTEMADRAKFWGRVGGIFHTDELPAYGITAKEIDSLQEATKAKQGDAVVLVATTLAKASEALSAVTQRAREALKGIPQETRAAKPDGSTRYMRPRPGAARMYPETDVHPILITKNILENLENHLPEWPEEKMQRFTRDYGLNEKLAKQVLDSEFHPLFQEIVESIKISPTLVAVVLTETLKALKRDGVQVENLSEEQLSKMFQLLTSGDIVKEGIPDILTWLSEHPKSNPDEAIEILELEMLSEDRIVEIIAELIAENQSVIAKTKGKAFGILMGLIMKKVRGKANVKVVTKLLKKSLET
jgi:glutamyl-tRNA(Gln) amidotransferase subunit E